GVVGVVLASFVAGRASPIAGGADVGVVHDWHRWMRHGLEIGAETAEPLRIAFHREDHLAGQFRGEDGRAPATVFEDCLGGTVLSRDLARLLLREGQYRAPDGRACADIGEVWSGVLSR